MFEFKIEPFSPGAFEKLSMECHGESVLSEVTTDVPGTSAFLGELFEDGRRVLFFTFSKNEHGMCALTSTGHFDKTESPLPYLERVLTYLHEAGARMIFIEILSTREDQIAGALETGFEHHSTYRLNECIEIMQFVHREGGRADQGGNIAAFH